MILWSVAFLDCMLSEIEECLNSFALKISQLKDIAACRLCAVWVFLSSVELFIVVVNLFFWDILISCSLTLITVHLGFVIVS